MRIHQTKPLFAWDCLEDNPSLRTVRDFLEAVPDADLLASLNRARGRGRNDYPVHVLWGVTLLTIVLRHPSIEACLGELARNEALRRLIGIDREEGIPKKWSISRFLDALGRAPHLEILHEVFDAMVKRLGEVVPDLGQDTAGDATYLNARRKKDRGAKEEKAEGLPQAAGGRKEYTDADGRVTKVVEWFGYKLHLLADVKHEVGLAYRVTSTKKGDGETLPDLVGDAEVHLPPDRIQTLAYDKAAEVPMPGPTRRLVTMKLGPIQQALREWIPA